MDDAARAPEPAPQQPNTVRVAAPELQPRATSDENIVVEPLDWSHNDEDFTIVDPPPAPAASKARKQSRPTRSSKARPEEMLQNARSALVEGRIDEAAEIYGNLITFF